MKFLHYSQKPSCWVNHTELFKNMLESREKADKVSDFLMPSSISYVLKNFENKLKIKG